MIEAAHPKNETERLAALRALNILDTPIEERFEIITRLACRVLNVPIAAISLVDETRQWFKSIQGLNVCETSREVAFCSHAILADSMLVVPDATRDIRFADNPLVSGPPDIRFYAGQPISISAGINIGKLCAIDTKPRQISPEDALALRDLARLVELAFTSAVLSDAQIQMSFALKQAEREARIDSLTRLWNRRGIEGLLQHEWDFAERRGFPIALVMVDFDDLKQINDTHGHPVGDEVLRAGSHMLLSALRSYDSVGRLGGDEFMIILPGCDRQETNRCLGRLQDEFRRTPIRTKAGLCPFTVVASSRSVM